MPKISALQNLLAVHGVPRGSVQHSGVGGGGGSGLVGSRVVAPELLEHGAVLFNMLVDIVIGNVGKYEP